MSAFLERFRKNPRNWIIIVVALILIALIVWTGFLRFVECRPWAEWTGFGEYTGALLAEDRGKTLWDWMELLIIPAILGVGAILFNKSQKDNEQRLALDQQREDTLQSYLDNMAELLLKEKLIEKKEIEHNPTLDVAKVRTITTIRVLDTERKNIILQFLRDAYLADFLLMGVSFAGVDLSYVDLKKFGLKQVDLWRTVLRGAELEHAIMSQANLGWADLSGAYMREVDLSGAWMAGTNLSGAEMFYANLSEAYLEEANLSGAFLGRSNLSMTRLANSILRKASLVDVNLGRASLFHVDLTYADLRDANLDGADLTGAKLDFATLNGVNIRGGDLSFAKVKEKQLVEASSLENTRMPDGNKYNGCFNLVGDIGKAKEIGIDVNDPSSMAEFYGVTLEEYQRGQEWARENLPKLRGDTESDS